MNKVTADEILAVSQNQVMSIDFLFDDFDRLIQSPESVHRLRRFILDLAVRGKLLPQDPNDEPASELLKRIAVEKTRLVKAAEIRKSKKIPLTDCSSSLSRTLAGWAWVQLLDISRKIHYGFTAPANQQIETVRLLRITDIQQNKVQWRSVPGCEIDEKALRNFKLEAGDILIARTGGTIGKSFLVVELPVVAVFASYLIRVQGSHEIYARYLKLFLDSPIYWAQLREGARGAGQPNINGQTLGKMLIPLPPLAEQHRIVAKVDELMALSDRLEAARAEREATRNRLATTSLARLNAPDPETFQHDVAFALNNLVPLTTRPDQVKALRQTILNLAVRGKLVPQDQNDEPTSELLKRISVERNGLVAQKILRREKSLAAIDADEPPFKVPSGWKWSRIGDAALFTQYGTSTKSSSSEQGVPVLTMGNIQDGLVVWRNEKRIPSTAEELPALYLKQFDLLYNRTNSAELVGKTGIYLGEDDCRTFASYLIRIRASREHFSPHFLNLTMNTPEFRETQIVPLIKKQTGQANVNGTALRNMLIPVPPLTEQRRIVAKVDKLMALCDRLEASLATGDNTRRRLLAASLHEALNPDGNCEELAHER